MKEREVAEYIDSISGRGIVPGLDGIRELCRRLGNPQDALKFVHIAGTNGKGSVSAYIAEVLRCGGYRVGRYISPVIFEYRERIQVNGRPITREALGRLMEQVKQACEEMTAAGLNQPTAFEAETALGFLYWREKACDIVVLETGMGGLLDATNIVKNTVLAVITSVSMDHMRFLGDTPEKIAAQKAGILKPGVPAVSAEQLPEVQKVIADRAASLNCLLAVSERSGITSVKYGLERQRFSYGGFSGLEISLAGKYQIENAALAVEALKLLNVRGFPVTEEKLRQGLKQTAWPGRFTLVGKKPLFIVDGAHNEDGAKRLAESAEFYFTNKRIIYIMGVLKDKEYEKMIGLTHSLADQIITVTPPDNPRALTAYELAQEIARVHSGVTAVDSLEEAVEMARLLAGREDVIIAFGTLSFAGRLIKLAERR
ncbi:MAG: bifunctional folylpolyglutamate synthase/dihydrofolate synthase [Butyrivibrio sp.]|nr:bifunctional folylpolyglutamate synthase/dihydrofolate synthase [Acetatifactor muris]MCM1559991.1 bifunctional folylpolyglutamate synthase/dihydrofolate synthase [Butyrivibrio sp.]